MLKITTMKWMKQALQFKRQITPLLDGFRYPNICLVNNFFKKEIKKSLQNLYKWLTKVGGEDDLSLQGRVTGISPLTVVCRQPYFIEIGGLWYLCHTSLLAFSQHHVLALCLCHILAILTVFQTFSLLLQLFWWPMISALWWYYCNCLRAS